MTAEWAAPSMTPLNIHGFLLVWHDLIYLRQIDKKGKLSILGLGIGMAIFLV
jgi:hypothetical protein